MGDTGVPHSHQACTGEARGSWGPNKLAPCLKIGWPHLAWALGTHELAIPSIVLEGAHPHALL